MPFFFAFLLLPFQLHPHLSSFLSPSFLSSHVCVHSTSVVFRTIAKLAVWRAEVKQIAETLTPNLGSSSQLCHPGCAHSIDTYSLSQTQLFCLQQESDNNEGGTGKNKLIYKPELNP